MRYLALLLCLVACQPFGIGGSLQSFPAPVPTQTPPSGLTLTVVNAYKYHDITIDEFAGYCGAKAAEPLQPYITILGYGQTSERFPLAVEIKGDPYHCLAAGHVVNIIANQDLYLYTCRVEITLKRQGYGFAMIGPTGPRTDCKLRVTGRSSALFTFDYSRLPNASRSSF